MTRAGLSGAKAGSSKDAAKIAGIHLAGANARKSAVVLLEKSGQSTGFLSLYEKIGSSGTLFSDERILSILAGETRLMRALVDCPLTEPPCVACTRALCPGVIRCDDISVAMMMAMEQTRGRKGAHKLRPINPQNQRLWDVVYIRSGVLEQVEPSYSANLAPLVIRAKTLQRRLRSELPQLTLQETNIPIVLSQLHLLLQRKDWSREYRNFERGVRVRRDILNAISESENLNLQIKLDADAVAALSGSVEVFHAFIAAAMGVWTENGLTVCRPSLFDGQQGWVEILSTESKAEAPLHAPILSRAKRLS